MGGEAGASQGGEYVVAEEALVLLSGTSAKVAAVGHPLVLRKLCPLHVYTKDMTPPNPNRWERSFCSSGGSDIGGHPAVQLVERAATT